MSSAKWETHGGVRYKVDNGAGSVDRDGWIRYPTNPKVVVVGHQEYTIVQSAKKQKTQAKAETVKPSSFDEWVCLGGQYRDMVEVDEWAPVEVRKKLLADYRAFVKENQLS